MIYFCCDQLRRNAVRGSAINGIDFLEVLDRDAGDPADRQRILYVHLLNDPGDLNFSPENVRIEGGERITPVAVVDVTMGLDSQTNVVQVEVDPPGDFSTYVLRLVRGAADALHPIGFDPLLSSVEFSFKVECPSEFDCQPLRICPSSNEPQAAIDYLARDYASFRQRMLDRMAMIMPRWRERNAADLGLMLVELLAYVGDHLSYEIDAAGTEAYLGTARRRISVRRHARLVDYDINDGSNARTWVQVQVSDGADPDNPPELPAGTPMTTGIPGQGVRLAMDAPRILAQADVVFETLHPLELYRAHNEMHFHTWSDERCCLPAGATQATLAGHFPHLNGAEDGAVLVFEEVLGPHTGDAADADPIHRHAVRLTAVQAFEGLAPLTDPLTGEQITSITWSPSDALPFALCISTRTDKAHGERLAENVSVARGNIVLADHGLSVADEELGQVPPPRLAYGPRDGTDPCEHESSRRPPSRFNPALVEKPLTQAAPFEAHNSAQAAMKWLPRDVKPEIELHSQLATDTAHWSAQRDLLNSNGFDPHFVAEIENDGTTFLRFGDDDHSRRPEPGTRFTATYRVGNGAAGNIGVDSLVHVRSTLGEITRVRNLTPGKGGTEPETMEDVRQRAPHAFRTQERAVTPGDYEAVTNRHPGIQRTAATFLWTGSWYTVFLTLDRTGGLDVDQVFRSAVRSHVEPFRMAGYDLTVNAPRFVSLEIDMTVCVRPEYFRSSVKADVLAVFSSRRLPDSRLGVFHPDHFSFGQTVYLSPFYAAAQRIAGVASVQITRFHRQGEADPEPLSAGRLTLHRLEIARLDNDPNFPEHGVFRLKMKGGK